MIRSFQHKGLERFHATGDKSGIRPEQARRLARILDRLDASVTAQDMRLPGYRLHRLSGSRKGTWSVSVSGNWRVTFRFEGQDATEVNYLDYH